jgi:hypothetical protein
MLDLKNLFNGASGPVSSILPLLRTADVDGSSADLKDYEGCAFLVHCGTVTDGTHTLVLEESDDDSTWAAIADADLDGSEEAYITTNDDQVDVVYYRGTSRYVRATVIATGSPATGATIGVSILRSYPRGFNPI